MPYIWEHAKWPHFEWRADRLINALSRARLMQGKLLSKIRSLGLDTSQESRSEILIEEAVKTSAIEGIRLDKAAVRSSVARRLGLPVAGLRSPDRNAEGLIDVMLEATTNYKNPLTTKRIKSWQTALFPTGYSGLSKIRVNAWRGKSPMRVVSGPVGHEKIHFEAPPSGRVNSEMHTFIKWWEKDSRSTEGLLRAGIAHFYFVTIHPFEDGNGRLARVLSDMALAQDENLAKRFYSLSGRIMAERKTYYEILERSSKGALDITNWLRWFLECYARAIEDSEVTISQVLKKAEFWQKHAEVPLNKNQRKVINRLLEAKPGEFTGGLSTRKYVAMVKVSRATAYRDIDDMLSKKLLVQRKGKGRSVSHDLRF